MPLEFRFDTETGYLDWAYRGDNVNPSVEEARVIAEAEKAAALRDLGNVMASMVEEIREAHLKMSKPD